MFDLSLAELLLIAVVALLVIGPEEMPIVVRTIVKYIRSLKFWASDIKKQVIDAIDAEDIHTEMKEISSELETSRKFILDDNGDYREVHDISDMLSAEAEKRKPADE